MQQHRTCLQWIKKEYKIVPFMIIIMLITYLYGQALEMEVAKIKTLFKVLGLWKFYLF